MISSSGNGRAIFGAGSRWTMAFILTAMATNA